MNKKLEFRRQFLLTIAPITPLPDWKCFQIDEYSLYNHLDLEVNIESDPKKSVVLIGNIYDSAEPQKGNAEILKDIMASAHSMESLVSYVKRYAGRYALLYKATKEAVILPDALGLREIYYCTKNNQIVCGSQPNLVAKFANPEVKLTSDPDLLEFYRSHSKDSKWDPECMWVGGETCYEGVKHLLPNHCLDINRREVRRFWPNEPIKRLELDEAVFKSCTFLQGNMRAMAHRHSVMMAVTAGYDSRTLLAASRDIQDRIYYFVNNNGQGHSHPDISIPKDIFKRIGISFHVHDVPKVVDDDFRQIFLSNAFFATERILPAIYNVYFKNHCNKVNILGIGEIGRTRFGKEPRNLNSYRMAHKLNYFEDLYAIKKCEQILAEMLPVYKKFGINLLTGFYWEQMLGNWGATGNSESDIAIEEVNPCNSHQLYEVFLGVDNKYTKYKNNILFEKMIQRMWPELLEWPINPPYNMKAKVAKFLKQLGVYGLLIELKYQVNYVRHLYKTRL